MTVEELRTNWKYRFFEGFTGMTAVLFILILVVLAIWFPTFLAVFLIIYSFFIVLKSSLHTIYTFYTFNNVYRWENIKWQTLLQQMQTDSEAAKHQMKAYQDQYKDKLNWTHEWNELLSVYDQNLGTKLESPLDLFQIVFVPIYNESVEVMIQSIQRIHNSGYPLDKIWLVIAREARAGEDFNLSIQTKLQNLEWTNVIDLDQNSTENTNLKNTQYYKQFASQPNKLTILLCKHPADLSGEIKGKGSNLDWAGRQVSALIEELPKAQTLDEETTLITVLDCDSRPGKNFFQILAFRYCLTADRQNVGFQPIPVFTNNYFDSTLLSSLVATGTTLWNFVQSSIPEEIHHFANYSVSLKLLRQTKFWVKDLVSEDSLFFDKNFCELEGKYRSLPTFAYFESDVVESDTFGEALFNQYKQLRRWAYGGVEGMSYLANRLLLQPEGKKIDARKRFMILYNEWVGHFFWSTMPFVFCFIMFLPSIFNTDFSNTVVASNLSFFSQAFSLMSYGFLFVNGFVILHFIKTRLAHRNIKLDWHHYLDIFLQIIVSPIMFAIWFLPPIEAQIRGIFGWYLGFWVTPKKVTNTDLEKDTLR